MQHRVYIIGNGFDLAHGYPTSYNHFLRDLLSGILKDIEITNESQTFLGNFFVPENKQAAYKEYLNRANYKEKPITVFNQCLKNYFRPTWHHSFFKKIITEKGAVNWVDFEVDFFEELIFLKNKYNKASVSHKSEFIEQIQKFNIHFNEFKTALFDYLQHEKSKRKFKASSEMYKALKESITHQDSNKYLFLNFNYSNLIEDYLLEGNGIFTADNSQVVHIHGQLDSEENPPIFGFGDEFDSRFVSLEEDNIPELYKHMKIFQYNQTNNFRELYKFLVLQKYDVEILGHSCGASDRTLLNLILDNENCIRINSYYYQNPRTGIDDYDTRCYQILRHFRSNKRDFLTKFMSKPESKIFPQIK